MERILVSACLIGDKTRYDGNSNDFPFLERLNRKYDLVPFCPEVEGGLPVPRPKSEIRGGAVIDEHGKDVTPLFNRGAEKALALCRYLGISIAILKDGSPSCGSRRIHDGSFTSAMKDGTGITAARLIAAGIKVYSEKDNLEFLLDEKDVEKKPGKPGIYTKANPNAEEKKSENPRKSRVDYRKSRKSAVDGEKKPRREGERKSRPGSNGKPYAKSPNGKSSYGRKKPGYGKPRGFKKAEGGNRKPFAGRKPGYRKGAKPSYGKKDK